MLDTAQKRRHNTGKASQPKIISDYNSSNGNKKKDNFFPQKHG